MNKLHKDTGCILEIHETFFKHPENKNKITQENLVGLFHNHVFVDGRVKEKYQGG